MALGTRKLEFAHVLFWSSSARGRNPLEADCSGPSENRDESAEPEIIYGRFPAIARTAGFDNGGANDDCNGLGVKRLQLRKVPHCGEKIHLPNQQRRLAWEVANGGTAAVFDF